jgi:hypothetical protein
VEAPDDLVACYRALLESVGYWTMSNINPKTFGGKPKPVTASGRDRVEGILLLRGISYTLAWPLGAATVCGTIPWGTQWGQ